MHTHTVAESNMGERTDIQRVKAVFVEAAERSGLERASYLATACAGDAGLRAEVEALLHASENTSGLAGGTSGNHPNVDDPHLDDSGSAITEGPGSRIGRYKLLQQIGQGGFGVVFMAEQEQPVRRKVAIKVIKLGMDTRQVIARFEAERQALAMMDHPNIATVLDAGSTEAGRPYFVMELVTGVPLTEFCDENELTMRERLELFVPVCQAVQHAHQKGIIHRDLKPSNVLVTMHDDKPVPKVIDFGIAKATQERLTERTLFTEFRQFMGTPQYTSPEQAQMSGLDVDTRADIYSLGVILYELLTGTTPLDAQALRSSGLADVQRMIREAEPPCPSARLSTLGQRLKMVAAQRRADPKRLRRTVRGELDWIVMKCLEKDRTRRYETANGLARDIERFLRNEPVEACPPSAAYRLRKLVHRNRNAVMAGTFVAASLVTAVVGLTISNLRIASERNAKVEALEHAERQERIAAENALKAQAQHAIAVEHEAVARRQETLARRRFYAAQMNLANRAWEEGEPARVLELLESQRPRADEEDLRSFEWFYLWRLAQRHHRWTARGHLAAIHSVGVSPDGRMAVSGSEDETAAVWDLATGQELARFYSAGGAVKPVLFAPDSARLATGSWKGLIEIWNVPRGRRELLLKHAHPIKSLAFSNDGRELASCDDAGAAALWDTDSGQQRSTLPGHPRPAPLMRYASSLRFAADGSTIAAAFFVPTLSTLGLWDLRDSPPSSHIFWEVPGVVKELAISPDMKTLAMDVWNGVQVREFSTGNLKSEVLDQKGHVLALAYTPDGAALVSGGASKTLRVLRLSPATGPTGTAPASPATRPGARDGSGRPEPSSAALGAHLAPLSAIAVSPDARTVVSADSDGVVSAWDLTAVDRARTVFPQHKPPLRSLLFTPDGRTLVATSGGGTRFWEVSSGRESARFPEAAGRAVLSPDARTFISANEEGGGMLKLWDISTGRLRFHALAHTKAVYGLAISPDGSLLASGAIDDPSVKFWEIGTELRLLGEVSLKGRANSIGSLSWSPDGRTLAVGTNRRELALVDVASRSLRLSVALNFDFTWTWSVAFSPDAILLAAGGASGVVTLWRTDTGLLHTSLRGHTAPINAIAFSPDGNTIATGSQDQTVRVWDVAAGQERVTFHNHPASVTALSFAPDGQALAAGSADGTVELWRGTPRGDPYVTSARRPDAYDSENPVPLIASAERLLRAGRTGDAEQTYRRALAGLDQLAGLSDPSLLRHRQGWAATVANLQELLTSMGQMEDAKELLETVKSRARTLNVVFPTTSIACAAQVWSVCVAHDDRRIVSGGADNTVRLWDQTTGQELRRFVGHAGSVKQVVFSPDQRQVLSGSSDGTARLWEVDSGKELRRLELLGDVKAVAFSPDGGLALCSSVGSRGGGHALLHVWDLSTGKTVRSFKAHGGPINTVCYAADGQMALTGSNDQTARLWNLADGQERIVLSGHVGPVTTAALLPDGRRGLSGSSDRTLRLWDLRTGTELLQFRGHLGGVEHVSVSRDGRLALSGGRDKMVRLWDVESGIELALLAGHTGIVTSVAFSPDDRRGISGSLDGTIRVWSLPAIQ